MLTVRHQLRCPFCHEHVALADLKAGCERCMAWHHTECLRENGRCASCSSPQTVTATKGGRRGRLTSKLFMSSWDSWHDLFDQAARFATSRGRDSLVSISHSHRGSEGLVTVWYHNQTPTVGKERLHFRHFSSTFSSWESLFREASDFAKTLPSADLVGLSHSGNGSEGVVTVWYWR